MTDWNISTLIEWSKSILLLSNKNALFQHSQHLHLCLNLFTTWAPVFQESFIPNLLAHGKCVQERRMKISLLRLVNAFTSDELSSYLPILTFGFFRGRLCHAVKQFPLGGRHSVTRKLYNFYKYLAIYINVFLPRRIKNFQRWF